MVDSFQFILIPKDAKVLLREDGFSLKRENDRIRFTELTQFLLKNNFMEDLRNEELNYFEKGTSYVSKNKSIEILINNGKKEPIEDSSYSVSIRPKGFNFRKEDLTAIFELIKDLDSVLTIKIFSVDNLKIVDLEEIKSEILK